MSEKEPSVTLSWSNWGTVLVGLERLEDEAAQDNNIGLWQWSAYELSKIKHQINMQLNDQE